MNEMQIFRSEEFGEVRAVLIDGEPYFVGKDVAERLGYSNPHKAIRDHVEDEDKRTERFVHPSGGSQDTIIINESGLYSLILSSKLPTAKKFKRWVTSEVLPSVRKTGYYVQDNEQANINVVFGVISKIKDKEVLALVSALSQKTESLLQETKEQKHLLELQSPKVEFADHIENSEGSISVSSFAKLMSKKGINTGRNRMLNWLRKQGYIGTTKKEYNQPKQIMINSGYMESEITTSQNNKNGKHIVKVVPMITGKGITYLSKKYLDFIKSHKIA